MAGKSIHQLGILTQSVNGPLNIPGISVSAATQNLLYGSSIGGQFFHDKDYLLYVMNEITNGIATSESNMAPRHIQPTQGVYSGYPAVDQEIAQAASVGAAFRGFPLIDGDNPPLTASPSWLTPACNNPANTLNVLTQTITNVMTHFKGKFKYTCVVNESMKPFGDPGNFRPNPFQAQLPASDPVNGYIGKALTIAKSVDPSTKVGLHFNRCETANSLDTNNQNAILAYVKLLLQNGIPLDYIACEGHLNGVSFISDWAGGGQTLAWAEALIALGLEFHVAEMDCNTVGLSNVNSTVDTIINNCLVTFLTKLLPLPKFTVCQSWELPDRWSWYNNQTPGVGSSGPSRGDNLTQRCTLLAWDYSPKKCYFGVTNAILASNRVTIGPPPPPPPVTLQSLVISPNNALVNVGGTIKFVVTGIGSDGKNFTPLPIVLIGSNNNTIFNVDGSTFIGTAHIVGSVTVTALVQGGPSVSTSVQVTPIVAGPLANIIINPVNPIVNIGQAIAFTASGIDSNGVVLPVQPAFQWSSSAPNIGAIDTNLGTFLSILNGVTIISVTANGITNSTTVSVSAPVIPPGGGGGTGGGTTPVSSGNQTPYGSGAGCNPFIRYGGLPRDPITGLVDWNLVNQMLDDYDIHASPFVTRLDVTLEQMNRDLGPNISNQSTASLNEQAWAARQIAQGIPASGILGRLA